MAHSKFVSTRQEFARQRERFSSAKLSAKWGGAIVESTMQFKIT
jgi:hypothetical protein